MARESIVIVTESSECEIAQRVTGYSRTVTVSVAE
jgi:hypothetical protein